MLTDKFFPALKRINELQQVTTKPNPPKDGNGKGAKMNLAEILIRRWSAVLIALLTSTALNSPLNAADVAVNCNRGDNLQTAINAALDWDVLTIKGTCSGTFQTSKHLKLEGSPKATLDGNGEGPVISVFGGSLVLENLDIVGGGGCRKLGGFFFAAGLLSVQSDVMLVETSVTGNHAQCVSPSFLYIAGGISAIQFTNVQSKLTIIDSEVKGNTASGESPIFVSAVGGIDSSASELILDGSVVQDNVASAVCTPGNFAAYCEAIGGIEQLDFIGGQTTTIIDSRVAHNSATGSSDGLTYADGGIGVISAPSLVGGETMIINSHVVNNHATSTGFAFGGVEFFFGGPITLDDSSFNGNSANAPVVIGGIAIDVTAATTISDSEVKRNVASTPGDPGFIVAGGIGDLSPADSVVTLEDSEVKNNVPNDCVGLVCDD
jgi:hypothetical protein